MLVFFKINSYEFLFKLWFVMTISICSGDRAFWSAGTWVKWRGLDLATSPYIGLVFNIYKYIYIFELILTTRSSRYCHSIFIIILLLVSTFNGDYFLNLFFSFNLFLNIYEFIFKIYHRSHWRKCCFSGDGEYICAGSMKQHSIYLWERASGTLVKILHGQKGETLLDVVWHPLRPIVVSISNSVTKEQVSIWAQTQVVGFCIVLRVFEYLKQFSLIF